MFLDTSMIVQSAASSFNNAAIVAPTFFWSALLMLPLFALVYKFGNNFIEQLNWNTFNNPKLRTFGFALCIEITLFAWLILMHGNYNALRDSSSALPFVLAGILFILTATIVETLRIINPPMPAFFQKTKRSRFFILATFFAIVVLAGGSGMPTFWGFIMHAAAVFCGVIVGRRERAINPIIFTSVVVFALSTVMLMQPEFFRFGQLGNLTILHKLFILLTSVLAIAIIVLAKVKSRGKIRKSAFIKLKYLARIAAGLCLVLFILTESVPVFLGLMAVLMVSFSMSVWHLESVPEKLYRKLWAILLCSFGIMTFLPMITAFGILYWTSLPASNVIKQSKFLL